MAYLLQAHNLRVAYASAHNELSPALAGVDFDLAAGEILGVLGESGSGKSTLAATLLNLLPPNGIVQSGTVLFENKNLLTASQRALQSIRGSRISLVFQEPSSSLHPTLRIIQQVRDILAAHTSLSRAALRERTMGALEIIFGHDASRIARCYPHELSGGQRQRVLIAQAIACRPAMLIADEPTASLDPITQREILALFRGIRDALGLSILLITHNPLLLDGLADRILVLYAGRIIETGPAAEILAAPQHPYTAALLRSLLPASIASIHAARSRKNHVVYSSAANAGFRLAVIPGEPPDLSQPSPGCRFEPRCSYKMAICATLEPVPVSIGESHSVCCVKFSDERELPS